MPHQGRWRDPRRLTFLARDFAQRLRGPTGIKFDYRIACPRKANLSAELLGGFNLIQSILSASVAA